METTPGDLSDWEDRNVSHYALFRVQNSLLSLTLRTYPVHLTSQAIGAIKWKQRIACIACTLFQTIGTIIWKPGFIHVIKLGRLEKKKCPHLTILGGFILRLVSIPQAYLWCTSDVNGYNFIVSRQLCSLGNACSSKPPKYTFKSC